MAGGLDFGKSREWAERLERYERSGLTVARWCESEEVSEASFYYWRKKLYYWRKKLRAGKMPATEGFASSRDAKTESRESCRTGPALGSFQPVRVRSVAGGISDESEMTSHVSSIQATTIHLGNEFRIELGTDLDVAEVVVKQVLAACGVLRDEAASTRESE